MQWFQNVILNDCGNFFITTASRIRLKKQSASVADLDSNARTAFLKGSRTNERTHKSEKKFRDRTIVVILSFAVVN